MSWSTEKEVVLAGIDGPVRPEGAVRHSELTCTPAGLSPGDVPLLRVTALGLSPRPAVEIEILLKAAYGGHVAAEGIMSGLKVIAHALNAGDLGRAMIAAIHLRLPALSGGGAAGVNFAADMLAKYNPDEPRDARGRWTTEGNGSAVRSLGQMGLIPVVNIRGANDNITARACYAATKQCQVSALSDKGRTNYFDKCWEAEDVCLLVLGISRADPRRLFGVVYPDGTVIQIEDGAAKVTHIGRVKLPQPLV